MMMWNESVAEILLRYDTQRSMFMLFNSFRICSVVLVNSCGMFGVVACCDGIA
jgi:hypothetical protein